MGKTIKALQVEKLDKQTVLAFIEKHNTQIDDFIANELPLRLGLNGERLNLSHWIKANEIIRAEQFYEKGREIQVPFREAGFDVKMDMQSHKLLLR